MTRAGAALATIALAACGLSRPLPDVEGGVEVGLRRGSGWSTAKVKRPYAVGPSLTLKFDGDRVTGSIAGRGVSLRLEEGGVSGQGPRGSVAFDIVERGDELAIEGSWNGSRVHFRITPAALRGTIAVRQGPTLDGVLHCQYVLDRQRGHVRVGTSICSGLPEDTELDVPPEIARQLSRRQLVVLLLTLLSSPAYAGT